MTKVLFRLSFALLTLVLFSNCEKKDDLSPLNFEDLTLAELSTVEVSNITHESAFSGGVIINEGNSTISDKGVCWSTSANPTISGYSNSNGTNATDFESEIPNLNAETTYYVRAYATNSAGTAYGNQLTFQSSPPQISSFSALIDGSPYFPASMTVNTIGNQIGISAMNGNQNMIIWLPLDVSVGVHDLVGDYSAQYLPSMTSIYSSTSGSIDISEYNETTGKLVATFSFTGLHTNLTTTIEVTDGQLVTFL